MSNLKGGEEKGCETSIIKNNLINMVDIDNQTSKNVNLDRQLKEIKQSVNTNKFINGQFSNEDLDLLKELSCY